MRSFSKFERDFKFLNLKDHMRGNYLLLILFSSPLLPSFAYSANCPTPPTSIEPSITVKIDFDKKSSNYTYSYSITNNSSALIPIGLFVIPVRKNPLRFTSPVKWSGIILSEGQANSRFSWGSAFQSELIKPGSTKSGFTLTSSSGPGNIQYFTLGDTAPRETVTINNDDEAAPDCPGYYDDSPLLETMVAGITQGPIGDDRLSIDIALKDSNGERDFGAVSPYEDKGLLNVLAKGNRELDLNELDLTSLRFGVGKASLVSSKPLGSSNNLLLQFDIQKTAIECGRDRVLFLTGKTKAGKEFLGGASVTTKNCDKRPKRVDPTPRPKRKSKQ